MAEADIRLVFTSCPDRKEAEHLARALVEERLAACVTIFGGASSIYRWEGALHADAEWPLMIKTTLHAWPALHKRLRAMHPYQLPEIIAVPVTEGLPAYLQWVRDETHS